MKKPISISEVNALLASSENSEERRATGSNAERNHMLAQFAADFALAKKATDVTILDLHEITSMTDYFVIATGSSDRQVKAIADSVLEEMKSQFGEDPWKTEGWQGMQWIILDYIDIVVHVFGSEPREFYNLERLWADAPREVRTDKSLGAKEFEQPAKAASTKKRTSIKGGPKIKVISRSNSGGFESASNDTESLS